MVSVLSSTDTGDPSIPADPDLALVVLIVAVLLMFSAVRLLSPTLALAGELLRVVMKGAAAAIIVVVALALLVVAVVLYLPR